MTYDELKEINSDKPPKALLYQALMENAGITSFYKEQFELTKKRYWTGKILNAVKQKKLIVEKFEKTYNTKITNP